MTTPLAIRPAEATDAAAIAAIYAHHVAHGTASYDDEARSVAATAAMIADYHRRGWPFLVAGDDRPGGGPLHGYAYAGQFRPRAAYRWTCEDSVYVHPAHQGAGVGGALLAALIAAATDAGFRQMIAVIGGAEPGSMALHGRLGFALVGRVANMGWKHGRWLDTVTMARALGAGADTAPGPPPGGGSPA